MTYNKLKQMYENYKFRTSAKEWGIVKKTKGNCEILDYNIDDEDKEIFFDVEF